MLQKLLIFAFCLAFVFCEIDEETETDWNNEDEFSTAAQDLLEVTKPPALLNHKRHHFPFPLPPFLKHCSPKARHQYIALLKDLSLSRKALYKKEEEWKKRQPAKIQKEVNQFNAFMRKHLAEVKRNATHTLQQFPKVLHDLAVVMADDNLPRRDEFKKVISILHKTDRQTAELTVAFFRVFTGHRRCPHPHCSVSKYTPKELERIAQSYAQIAGGTDEWMNV